MRFSLKYKGWHFYIGFSYSQRVKGICSQLRNGKHIILWDFDNVPEEDVKAELQRIQKKFKLPKIYLVNTGRDNYWHAYCFKQVDWSLLLYILSETRFVDSVYFGVGVLRHYFTLRITPKKGRDFKPAIILPSKYKEDISPFELDYSVYFWTKRI
jgi:hypothetical protein